MPVFGGNRLRTLQQAFDVVHKLLRRQRSRHSRPLYAAKFRRYPRCGISGVVHHDGQKEWYPFHEEVRLFDREFPLEPEISLSALLRVPGNDRNEKRAGIYLFADLLVPGVAAPEFALVKPHLNTIAEQGFCNAVGGGRVLARIAKKYGLAWTRGLSAFWHEAWGGSKAVEAVDRWPDKFLT